MRHGLTFPSVGNFSGESDRWRPSSFIVGDPGSTTSSKRIECALFAGLRLTRDRLAGVRSRVELAGDRKLWRPTNGFIGDEIRYSASPGGPKMSGEELSLRDMVDMAG